MREDNPIRRTLQPGDVVATTHLTIAPSTCTWGKWGKEQLKNARAATIRWATEARHSHVGIFVGGGQGGVVEADMDEGRVVLHSLTVALEGSPFIAVYRHRNISPPTALRVAIAARAKVGNFYSSLGAMLSALPIPDQVRQWCKAPDALFCSELVAQVFGEVGLSLGLRPAEAFTPATVTEAQDLKLVGLFVSGQPGIHV